MFRPHSLAFSMLIYRSSGCTFILYFTFSLLPRRQHELLSPLLPYSRFLSSFHARVCHVESQGEGGDLVMIVLKKRGFFFSCALGGTSFHSGERDKEIDEDEKLLFLNLMMMLLIMKRGYLALESVKVMRCRSAEALKRQPLACRLVSFFLILVTNLVAITLRHSRR